MAKQRKRTTVTVNQGRLEEYRGDILALGVYKGSKRLAGEYVGLDKAVGGIIADLLKLGDFKGKVNETVVLYAGGKSKCRRIMLVGLGDKKKIKLETLRQGAGTAARQADKLQAKRMGLALHSLVIPDIKGQEAGKAIAEGVIMGRYDYQDYMPAKKNNTGGDTMRVAIVEPKAGVAAKLGQGCKVGVCQGEGHNQARMIANMPGNELNPPKLALESQRLARQFGLKCKVFNERQMAQMGMNAILAVGSGSASKPRLIMLEYKGGKGASKTAKPDLVVVGKAVTFDSGGLSLKPSQNMEKMKFDKCGGCAVLGIMTAAAQLKLPVHLVGLIPSAENLPSHSSYRPGDIIRTYSGKTIEVQNTDAEGRIILSDALAYAAKMKPKAIIDMATLTGACVVALGEHHAGLFGNNDKLLAKLKTAAQSSGEGLWQMPSGEDYLEQMRSKIADLKNIAGREGASCTAAAFLGEFVDDIPWAHIDIAATADTDKAKPYRSVGATGFGVRLILEYLKII